MSEEMLLDDLEMDDEMESGGDNLGKGFQPLESGAYDCVIELAYLGESSGGARNVNLTLVTNDNRKIRETVYISSGSAKGTKSYYYDKRSGKNKMLPGFEMINDLCLLAGSKPLKAAKKGGKQVTLVKQTHKIYDFDQRAEVPTEVVVIKDIMGKEITAGILKVIEDKKSKDESGEYVATGETRIKNEIVKFFRKKDGLTVTEVKAKAEEPAFMNKWIDTWTGDIKDTSTGDAGTQGMPPGTGASDTTATADDELF